MTQTENGFDYKKLGLKVGIEIHQQLETKSKLFCRCQNKLRTLEPDFRLYRTFRPVLGEEGKFDDAMLLEFKKQNLIEYEGYHDICTYEYDETPPFKCDDESMDIALKIALLLNMNIIDELHICRKNYVDGSVPAGFQRTMIVGVDGKIPLNSEKSLGIEIICLEEESCRKITQVGNKVTFRLDRLGIPLVEVATAPDMNTPEEARAGALRLGMLLRGTGNVKRVLGATRQDINVSIKGGSRIEIKGVQRLDWIPLLVKNECNRQSVLLEIKKEMKSRGLNAKILKQKPIDLTSILKNTQCKFVNKGIKNKLSVFGLKVPKMKGIFGREVQEGKRFGTEVADKVRIVTGLKGIIHSDENLEKYNFNLNEINNIKNKLKCEEDDLFVLIMGSKTRLKDAFEICLNRIMYGLKGVPGETRKPLENGTHEFLRDIHGGARLYPDTDSREIILDKMRIDKIQKELPEYPWKVIPRLSKKYNLSSNQVENLLMNGFLILFEKILAIFSGKSILIYTTIVDLVKSLHREGKEVDNITDDHYIELFEQVEKGKIAKEAFEQVLSYICEHPESSISSATKEMKILSMTQEDLNKLVLKNIPQFKNLIKERGMGALGPVMGAVMKEARGKIDGKLVSNSVKKAIQKIIEGEK